MITYPNSSYGFCETCRKTDVPALLDDVSGFQFVCPTCMDLESELAVSATDKCAFVNCGREADTFCGKCGDEICKFHENSDGFCDECSPLPQRTGSYNAGWSARTQHWDH